MFRVRGKHVLNPTNGALVLALLVGQVHDLPIRPLPWRSLGVVAAAGVVAALIGAAVYWLTVWPVGVVAGTIAYVAVLHGGNVEGPGGLRALWRNSRLGN